MDSSEQQQRQSVCTQLWMDKLSRRNRRLKEREEYLKSQRDKGEKYAYDPFEPDWDCEMRDRVGSPPMGDGAKYVCGLELLADRKSCLVYGVGGGEFKFEMAVKQVGKICEFHSFDPFFKPKDDSILKNYNIHFHSAGLGYGIIKNSNGENVTLQSITEIMKANGHIGQRIELFKIDCEGCEYSLLPPIFEMVKNGKLEVGQIFVELHGTSHSGIENFFRELSSAINLFVFHKEHNHDGCDGYRCVEYGIMSREFALEVFNRYTGCDVKEDLSS